MQMWRGYVGSSRRAICTRICEHRSQIKNDIVETPLVAHFQEQGHDSEEFKLLVLEQVKQHTYNSIDITKVLLQQEARWIFCLKT